MKSIQLILTATGTNARIEMQKTVNLAWELAAAIAHILGLARTFNARAMHPRVTDTKVALLGEIDRSHMFAIDDDFSERATLVANLLNSADALVTTALADRVLDNARLPVPVAHAPEMTEILDYERATDHLRCKIPNPSEVVQPFLRLMKGLALVSASDLTATLILHGRDFAFPRVSRTVFSHGFGMGRSIVSTCCLSGVFVIAKAGELRIDEFRNGRAIQAQLSEPAREVAYENFKPKFQYTAALQYAEAMPLMPFLPGKNGKVIVEKMWDFQEQGELPLE